MSEIWTFFHKAPGAVRCNGCAYETWNSRDSPAHVDALWAHLRSAHRDVYERSHHFETNTSTSSTKVHISPTNLPSEIWNFFTKAGTARVKCKLCSHIMSHGYRKSTHGLWGHIKAKHLEEFKQTIFFRSRSLRADASSPSQKQSGNGERQQAVRTSSRALVTSKTDSEIWMFFARLSSDHARCIICSRDICRAVSPNRLWEHLKSRHDDVFRATDHFKSLQTENDLWLVPSGPRPELHDHAYTAPPSTKRLRATDDVDVLVDDGEENVVRVPCFTVEDSDDDIIWI